MQGVTGCHGSKSRENNVRSIICAAVLFLASVALGQDAITIIREAAGRATDSNSAENRSKARVELLRMAENKKAGSFKLEDADKAALVSYFLKFIDSDTDTIRCTGIAGLTELGSQSDLPLLLKILTKDRSDKCQSVALKSIIKLGKGSQDKAAVEALADIVRDDKDDRESRVLCIQGIGEIGGERARALLISISKDLDKRNPAKGATAINKKNFEARRAMYKEAVAKAVDKLDANEKKSQGK